VNLHEVLDSTLRRAGNEIRVTTSVEPGGAVLVRIVETGGSIPRQIQKRLFTPCFTTKEVGIGTGEQRVPWVRFNEVYAYVKWDGASSATLIETSVEPAPPLLVPVTVYVVAGEIPLGVHAPFSQ